MTKQTILDSACEARAKALAALIDAVDVYKAFQTLEPTGLVHDECGDGLDDAVCDAAAELLDADAAYGDALEEEPEPGKAETSATGPSLHDVKAAIVAGQKRAATAAIQKIVIDHGGSVQENGTARPALAALPRSNYAKVIAAIKALPSY
jgi:hypothetical protein